MLHNTLSPISVPTIMLIKTSPEIVGKTDVDFVILIFPKEINAIHKLGTLGNLI